MALSQLNLEPDALSKPLHHPPPRNVYSALQLCSKKQLELTKLEMGGKRP